MQSGKKFEEIIGKLDKINNDEFAELLDKFPYDMQLYLIKKRCETGDKAACKVYDIAVNGDKNAPVGSDEYLGLRGRWIEKKDGYAKILLEKLGEL